MRPGERRIGLIVAVLAMVVTASIVGGWQLAIAFQSPAQREAASKPPRAAAITSEVVKGRLDQLVTTRAQITRESTQTISVPAQGENSVVTKAPLPAGSTVIAGKVAIEINGRPVFAVPGLFSFYRDMAPGMKGPDIRQLQDGLGAAGYAISVDGNFGPDTERAVRALYRSSGYEVLTTSGASVVTDAKSLPSTSGTTGDSNSGQSMPVTPSSPILRVPYTEFVVLHQASAFIVNVPPVGAQVTSGTSLTVEQGPVVATASVSTSVSAQLKRGMTATLQSTGGQTVSGIVQEVGTATTAKDSSGSAPNDAGTPSGASASADSGSSTSSKAEAQVIISAKPAAPIPDAWLHSNVLAEISIRQVAATSLIVPSVAVVSAADGKAHVFKRLSDGSFRAIAVVETASLDGRSAVQPVKADQLKSGDVVKVR